MMKANKFLVIGATGHVGSKVAILLADKGYDVTALVRQAGATIRDPHSGPIKYITGDLSDEASIQQAVRGMDVVISTANGIIPQRKADSVTSVNEGALRLIALCEAAGVRRFVQSSVPSYKNEQQVPELWGKRALEQRLLASKMQSVIVRNAAFMDVFLVMTGFKQAEDKSLHATTKRNYGFTKFWTEVAGNLVQNRGWLLAPGGAKHGTPFIATRDVAEMLIGGALYEGQENLLIESGGPQWLTWRAIADIIGQKTGKKIRVISVPAWLVRLNRLLVKPFSESAANVFAMLGFVADFQPRWDSAAAVRKLKLPKQLTLADYLDLNYARQPIAG